MTAIVMNTLNGAVTEYDGFMFDSITPTHAGSAVGLFALGGDTDAGQPIVARFATGKTHWGQPAKKMLDLAFVHILGTGAARMKVHGAMAAYEYAMVIEAQGQSRCKFGRGIRESYLAFEFSKPDGKAFSLDRIDIIIGASRTRRTQ